MKTKQTMGSLLCAVTVLTLSAAQAQVSVYKADNSDSLDLFTSWTNGAAPTSLDTAIWDANVATAANCSNSLAAAVSWAGIQILNPAAAVKIATNSSNPSLTLGSGGIDLNEPGTTRDLWVAPSITTAGDQVWSAANGRTLILGEVNNNLNVQNNVTVNGHVIYVQNLRVQGANGVGGSLLITNSATTLEPSAATNNVQILVANNNTGVSSVLQTAGTVKLRRNGTTGSPQIALRIGASGTSTAIYTITGGVLQDISPANTTTCNVGDSSGSTGTFNVDGTASVTLGSIRLGNATTATGIMNVTNGTVLVTGGTFDVGRSSSGYTLGAVNVYGGTVTSIAGMDVPHGLGPGSVTNNGGSIFLGGAMNVTASGTTVGNGVVVMNSGSLTISNSLNLPNGAVGTGTVILNGGVVTLNSVAHPGAAAGTLILNGGTLKARQNNTTFIAAALTPNVMSGGAVLDSGTFNVTVPAALLNGTGGSADGGLTKLGTGALTLTGANTYNGPTIVQAGSLNIASTNLSGGSISASNTTTLSVTLGAAGTPLNCSSLTLGSAATDSLTLALSFNGFLDTVTPIIHATNLIAAATNYINVGGSGFGIHTYHLIRYDGAMTGGGSFVLNSVNGAVGYVTNDASGSVHYINLVITALPSLVWRAQVNTNWDSVTTNWVDLITLSPAAYPNGASVLFNDSASNTLVNVTATWTPANIVINNTSSNYTFAGAGKLSGITGLNKFGLGTLLMALTNSNDYAGDTVISNGIFRIGATNVIPDGTAKGNVVLEGKLDLNGFNETVNALNGLNGVVDNSSATPSTFTVGNNDASGIFAGLITNSGASTLSFTKNGAGSLVLLNKNGYSGVTTLGGGGTLQLAFEQSISSGPLSIGGSSTLCWTDPAAHVLNNPLTLTGTGIFGADTNGPLTVPGTVNLNNGNRGVACNSDVLFANGFTNGGLSSKSGPATLTVKGVAGPDWTGGSFQHSGGTLILDNVTVVEHVNNFRIQGQITNGLTLLVVTNGASVTTADSATSNFKVGATDVTGSPGGTNQLDIYGAVTVTPYPGTGDKFIIGGPSARDIVNLNAGGVLTVRQVNAATGAGVVSTKDFNFNGGILRPNTNDLAASFMQGLDNALILDGGAFIDTAGWNITIGQYLQSGGTGIGGLTKSGAGILTLSANNPYTGDTVINAGTLALSGGVGLASTNIVVGATATFDVSGGALILNSGQILKGNGTVLGTVDVTPGAVIAPGTSIGVLTFSNAPVLQGEVRMELGKSGSTPISDELVLAGPDTLTYDGILTVTLVSGSLTGGETFKLFNAESGVYAGVFAVTNLPALPSPLTWDLSNLNVNGTIKVNGTISHPYFTGATLQNGALVMSGSGGSAGSDYYVLTSTNVALPLASWTRVATNQFGLGGAFSITNPVSSTTPQKFFGLQVP